MTSEQASARALSIERAGQSNAPAGTTRAHTLVIVLNEKPGAVDRVVGLLRRRRANMQALTVARGEHPKVTRITAVIDDAEVAVEQLVEQLRKIVDVCQVSNSAAEQLVERELALIKVSSNAACSQEIIELGEQFGAHIAAVSTETVTLEVSGRAAKVEQLVHRLQPFGVREVARTGSVALPRGRAETER